MTAFFSFLKVFVACGTLFFIAMLVLLAMPQSRLRSVGLEIGKYVMAAGLALLIVSPIDVIPDVLPGLGWADDVGYLVGAIFAIRSGLAERRQRALMEP